MRTFRMRHVVGPLAALTLVFGLATSSAQAAPPCAEWPFTDPAQSIFHHVTIPVLGGTSPTGGYDAVVLRPSPIASGARVPGIVLLHGKGGNKCGLWWAARLLAGHDYETVVLSYPSGGAVPAAELSAAKATRSAIAWLRSSHNPYRAHLDRKRIGLVGHSLGAVAAQDVQQDSSLPWVRTIIALDNLRMFIDSDAGSVVDCNPATRARRIKPRVPALGLGSETGCPDPSQTDKTTGFVNWTTARPTPVYAEEAVLANATHVNYAGGGATNPDPAHVTQLEHAAYYIVSWMERWLRVPHGATAPLYDQMPFGIPITDMLTDPTGLPIFTSSAHLPGKDCPDLRACP